VSVVLGAPIVDADRCSRSPTVEPTLVLWSSCCSRRSTLYEPCAPALHVPRRFITPDELWAVAATFTVIAWGFAHAYMAIQVVWPGSFTRRAPDAPRTWFELLFLSFTNLTSVGLSDVVPVLAQAGPIVMIEQVAGLMYVAIVISRIVGLQLTRTLGHEG
jgi:hypothetical protein